MNILLNINHPAHVHLFKHAIWSWQKRGHKTLVVARDKDITVTLLNHYGISFILGSVRQSGMLNQGKELLVHTIKILKVSRRFNPDVLVSMGSPMAAWASLLSGVPHLSFDDTEHARSEHMLYRPFTRVIYTPSCFTDNLGSKQRRYNGYHELAYLHPNWFTPNPKILQEIGLTEQDPFYIIRFVSWEATHDVNQYGFSYSGKQRLVAELQKQGRVIITSESSLPPEFESYRLTISPTKIHDLLYYSSLYIGEGGTMASEAAVLGTPSIYVNSLPLGYLAEQESKYGLVYKITNEQRAIDLAVQLARDKQARIEYRQRRQRMLADKIDVTAWLVDLVEQVVEKNNF